MVKNTDMINNIRIQLSTLVRCGLEVDNKRFHKCGELQTDYYTSSTDQERVVLVQRTKLCRCEVRHKSVAMA
ncbi:hypothetical protein EVAR_10542_1 [Eumeta japonica]|uniref:Uncharacterized protein n=1 Tax=Eumeta variegata TaxID=151549 RepID=A0A4C1TKL6_EUMVA|nr:hypothetical protein EVAR_10542_1 [Eumeta japonica]